MVDFLIYKALAEVRPQIEPRNELLGLDPFVDLRTLPSALFNYQGDYSGRRHLLGRGTGLHGLRAGTSGAAARRRNKPKSHHGYHACRNPGSFREELPAKEH